MASSQEGMSVFLLPVNVNIAASGFYWRIFFAMNGKPRAVVIGGVPLGTRSIELGQFKYMR